MPDQNTEPRLQTYRCAIRDPAARVHGPESPAAQNGSDLVNLLKRLLLHFDCREKWQKRGWVFDSHNKPPRTDQSHQLATNRAYKYINFLGVTSTIKRWYMNGSVAEDLPGWSWIFPGRWSMLDGLQMCEKEPNFDSNIFVPGKKKAGVHDPYAAKGESVRTRGERGAGRGGVSNRSRGSCWLRENESKSSGAVRQLRRTAPRHSRVTTAKSSSVARKTGMKNGSCLSTRARPMKAGPLEVEEPSGACSVRVERVLRSEAAPLLGAYPLKSRCCLSCGAVLTSQYFDARWDGGIPTPPIQVDTPVGSHRKKSPFFVACAFW